MGCRTGPHLLRLPGRLPRSALPHSGFISTYCYSPLARAGDRLGSAGGSRTFRNQVKHRPDAYATNAGRTSQALGKLHGPGSGSVRPPRTPRASMAPGT